MVRSLSAMVVDDSSVTRKQVMESLSLTGLATFDFTEADDGVEALESYRPGELDLLFVDLHMPRMNGVAFLQKLRSTYQASPPAVMITSEASMDRVLTAVKDADVQGFLFKPLNPDRLREGLLSLVDSLPVRSGPSAVPHGECVAQALQEIVESSCGFKLESTKTDNSAHSGDIVFANVNVQGHVQWSVTIGFERAAAEIIASKFACSDGRLDNQEMGDALGELASIVASQLKRLLNQRGVEAQMSLPMVSCAQQLQVLLQRRTTRETFHFNSPAGKLWAGVTVGLQSGLIL